MVGINVNQGGNYVLYKQFRYDKYVVRGTFVGNIVAMPKRCKDSHISTLLWVFYKFVLNRSQIFNRAAIRTISVICQFQSTRLHTTCDQHAMCDDGCNESGCLHM